MQTSDIIKAIDSEIEKLRQVKTLLIGAVEAEAPAKPKGRPKQDKSQAQTIRLKAKRSLGTKGKSTPAVAQKVKRETPRKNAIKLAPVAVKQNSVKRARVKTATTKPAKKKGHAEIPVYAPAPGPDSTAL
jgi:hypothetical protein